LLIKREILGNVLELLNDGHIRSAIGGVHTDINTLKFPSAARRYFVPSNLEALTKPTLISALRAALRIFNEGALGVMWQRIYFKEKD
jgi:hypothetical protein